MHKEQEFTRKDLLSSYLDNHAAAWDRLRAICIDYGLNPPTFLEITQANAGSPEGNMINGSGENWFDYLGIQDLEIALMTANESIVAFKGGGVLNIEGGYFIKLPGHYRQSDL